MRIVQIVVLTCALLTSRFACAADYKAGSITIGSPWARATPNDARVAAGYMKIQNTGTAADRLVGGSATISGSVQIHEMSMDKDVMKMRELPAGLELLPGQSIEFKPGSYHVMFINLKRPLIEGQTVKGTLVFEKAGQVEIEYAVRAIGSSGDHNHMMHMPQ